MTIQSNLSGSSVMLNSATGCTALSASGSNVNLTFSDLTIGGTGQGMNLTNTGSATFNNVTLSGTLTTVSSLNGPGTLTLNYPASSASNNLTVAQSTLNFTQFGTSNVTLLTANFALNANLGTTAGSAGNNTISLTSNMITGGAITTGGGQDQFNVSSAAPVTISAGSGNDTLTMTSAGAYVRSFNGDTGTDMIRGGNQNNYFDIDTAFGGNISLTRGISSTRTSFANTENLIGNAMADTFSFTSNSARIVSVNGGNGNDYLTFNGTSGANTSISYSNPLEFNVNGSSLGTVNYFNFANSTPTVSVVDNFTSLENLVGGSGSDVFRMKSVGVVQGSIAGTLNGATGNNTLDYSTYSSGVTVNLATRSASGIGSGSTLRISNIRDVYGSASRDRLTGDSGNNILVGNNGNDSILGGDGNDILIGSYGADTLVGGSGWNLDIGGYVNFLDGGASTAYGIPSQYVDFVLGSMMNQWSGVSNDGGFTTASNLLQTTGVSVQTPGNTTSYSNIRLYSDSTPGGPYGTVFNDTQVNSINPGTLTQNWIFYSSSDVVSDGSKVKKSSLIYKSFP
jgi:Ca2+-binding RTX toxin-like protein